MEMEESNTSDQTVTQIDIPGFRKLFIRDVPPGATLNAQTAEQFNLVECGTWVSEDALWMIDHSPGSPEGEYRITPLREWLTPIYYQKAHTEYTGSLEKVLKAHEELKQKANEELNRNIR